MAYDAITGRRKPNKPIGQPGVNTGDLKISSAAKPGAKSKQTFAQAFSEARKKGEGTKFTHNGKSYTAVSKADLKKKGYDGNELPAYNKNKGKARGALSKIGQGVKKVLLGKDKKFGGDKGLIDFIRKPKKKMDGGMMDKPVKKMGGGMMYKGGGGSVSSRKTSKRGVGIAKRGFGKALK
jgi:hypothetical protein|tara:strand:+ start:42 stop:581 length:540 start_codon:yes stop_codon:yes gene_type:complete